MLKKKEVVAVGCKKEKERNKKREPRKGTHLLVTLSIAAATAASFLLVAIAIAAATILSDEDALFHFTALESYVWLLQVYCFLSSDLMAKGELVRKIRLLFSLP